MKERRVSIDDVVKWGREIASALDHAHRRGVIHRDLKSANVAVTPDGSVKVLDFGLSRRIAEAHHRGNAPADILTSASVAGTLTHIAPEVLRGEPLDPRADLWALGVMLYEMTAGVLPFKRPTPFATADAILNSVPEPLPTTVPAALRRVIDRCLAKDPASRYATAAELRDALNGIPFDARSTSRRASIRAAIAGLAAVSVFALAGALYHNRQRAAPAEAAPVLAVLPLANTAGDPGQAFFAD